MWGFDKRRDDKDLIIDESSPNGPNVESASLDCHIEETMKV